MSQQAIAPTPPMLGSTGPADWEAVPLTSGSSVIEALRARNIPVTRDVLAAIAQVNGISDFRRIAAGTPIWLPRRESIAGERAQVWREAFQGISPDGFATVDRDRARGAVRGRTTDGPRLAAPATAAPRGPRPQQAAPSQDLTVDPLDIQAQPAAPEPQAPAAPQQPPPAQPELSVQQQPVDMAAQPAPQPVDLQAQPAPLPQPLEAQQPIAQEPAVDAQQPGMTAPPSPDPNHPGRVLLPAIAPPSDAPPAVAPVAAAEATAQLTQLVQALREQLTGPKDRNAVLRIVYAMMSSPDWTNQQARMLYAAAAGSQNEWQLIADLRASGLSSRDILRASEYVWNDESSPFDGQVSPPIRAVLAAIGFRERGFGQLDASIGTADASLEDALWDIVDGIGVDAANAVIASRAGTNPNGLGIVSNERFNHDSGSIFGRITDMIYPDRRPAPLDGSIQPAPQGSNPLADLISSEYARWKNVTGGFSGAQRDRALAILRMPPGTDRRSFDIAMAATQARGEDFLKLFEGRTREQVATIHAAFDAGFGAQHGGSLETHALAVLSGDQLTRFQALLMGTRSDPQSTARYIALSLRARASDPAAIRDTLKLLGTTDSGTPTWDDVVNADFRLNPERSQSAPIAAILQRLGNEAIVQVVQRDNASPDEPAGIARRIMGSTDPVEVARLLKRTDGDLFNDQELAIMNQTAARIAGGDPNARPSALFQYVAQLCGPNSEAALIVARIGGPQAPAAFYDDTGRLSPAAQLFFALQRNDAAAVSTLLSRTPFVQLSGVERAYEQVVAAMGQAQVAPPGGTADLRSAVRNALRGEDRQRALQFLTGFDVTSTEAMSQSGAQLAATITADLRSRCAWLLRQFDHEREPLEERLMQFEVTLAQVLTSVEQRRAAAGGQPTTLTEAEQIRLGEAVRRLVGQRRNFEVERDAISRSIQDTTILVSTTVASIAISLGTFGTGAPASAALLTTVAGRIATVAAIGTAAGLATAPLQGGDNPYLWGGLRGFSYGAFAGLGSASPQVNSLLARVIPGTGILAGTARNGIVMATVGAGISASNNIGVEFESRDAMIRKVGGDALRGAIFGLGFAGIMGLSQWMLRAAGVGPAAVGTPTEQLDQALRGYAGARDLRSMERAFAQLSGGQLPPPGTVLEISNEARTMLAKGIEQHLAALARTPATSVTAMTEQARWLTSLTLYADASGIQLQGEALRNAVSLMQRLGVVETTARLSEAQARTLLTQTAERLRDGEQILRASATANAPSANAGPAAATERGVRLVHGRSALELRSWQQVNVHARQAGTRAMPLDSALRTREELLTMRSMLETPSGQASLARLQGELGPIAQQEVDGLRRSYLSALGRVDRQIADALRNEAAQIGRAAVPANDVSQFYTRLGRLQEMQQSLGALRARGMTRELFDATSSSVAASRHTLDTQLAARVRETFANPGLDPQSMLGAVTQFRDTMRAQGFTEAAPETLRAFNEAIQRLQRAAANRAA